MPTVIAMEMQSADYGPAALDPDYQPGGRFYVEPDPLFDGNREQRRRARAEHNKAKGKARVAAARRARKDLEVVRKETAAVVRGGRAWDRDIEGTSASDRAAFARAERGMVRLTSTTPFVLNGVEYAGPSTMVSVSIF